jgi:hypothetical protein
MGFYYDWIDESWERIDHERRLTRQVRASIRRRGELINRFGVA